MTPLRHRLSGLFLATALLTLIGTGCAKAPSGGTGNINSGQLVVTMTVAGHINPNYIYFVLFNTTNTPLQSIGPIPVVAAPWGNGFAAGAFTQFLRYDASQANSGYNVFAVVPGSNLRSFVSLGAPIGFTAVPSGGNTIQFRIALAQLATSDIAAAQIQSLQVNFLATDRIPVDPNDPNPKSFDALGDARQPGGVNDPITISTLQSTVYQNGGLASEPAGDVTEAGNGVFQTVDNPDLDIVNWSIAVQD